MKVQPYLFFDGRCDEAIEFYRRTLGAEVLALLRFRDHPQASTPGIVPPGSEDKVMHAALRIGDSEVMASDGRCLDRPEFRGVALTLSVPNVSEADRIFAILAEGGEVQMPIGETFFSPRFGMVTDRFGLSWMIISAPL